MFFLSLYFEEDLGWDTPFHALAFQVRYQSRKRLAEQRPRVRGQFVRQTIQESKSQELEHNSREPEPRSREPDSWHSPKLRSSTYVNNRRFKILGGEKLLHGLQDARTAEAKLCTTIYLRTFNLCLLRRLFNDYCMDWFTTRKEIHFICINKRVLWFAMFIIIFVSASNFLACFIRLPSVFCLCDLWFIHSLLLHHKYFHSTLLPHTVQEATISCMVDCPSAELDFYWRWKAIVCTD